MWQNRCNSEFIFNIDIIISEILDQSNAVAKLKTELIKSLKFQLKSQLSEPIVWYFLTDLLDDFRKQSIKREIEFNVIVM